MQPKTKRRVSVCDLMKTMGFWYGGLAKHHHICLLPHSSHCVSSTHRLHKRLLFSPAITDERKIQSFEKSIRYATYYVFALKEVFAIMVGSMVSPWVGWASDFSPTTVNKENSDLVIRAHMKCPIVFDKFPMMAMGFPSVS